MCFFDCQADFDVDNVQRRELVDVYGVYRYIRVIIVIIIKNKAQPKADKCSSSASHFFTLTVV